MSPAIVERIKSRGYWRILFRPSTHSEKITGAPECERIVATNAVRIRGWEYPAVLLGSDRVGRSYEADGFAESVEFINFIEYWKLFRSGQFIHYVAFAEDWFDQDPEWARKHVPEIRPLEKLSFEETIYRAAEIHEFLARLVNTGLYAEPVSVSIQLHNLSKRSLWLRSHNRAPFLVEPQTGSDFIPVESTLEPERIVEESRVLSAQLLVRIFNCFGWEPSLDQMLAEVESAHSGRGL